MRVLASFLSAVLLLCLVACNSLEITASEGPVFASVTGSLTYPERMALPPEAIVLMQLLDVTSDQPQILAEQRLERPGQVPITFDLRYDSRAIQTDHAYVISARIVRGPRVLFINDSLMPVITRGQPTKIEIVLRRVPENEK